MKANSFLVADELLKRSKHKRMTFVRLKDLLYLAYLHHWMEYGKPLFSAEFVENRVCPVDRLMQKFLEDTYTVHRKDVRHLRKGKLGKKGMRTVRETVDRFDGVSEYDITTSIHHQARLLEQSTT